VFRLTADELALAYDIFLATLGQFATIREHVEFAIAAFWFILAL
jgi:hypothetical protein